MTSQNMSRRWDRMRPETLRELQARRLRHFLSTRVAPFSEHYRGVFRQAGFDPAGLRSLDDLQQLPFTRKDDLQPNPRAFVLIPERGTLMRQPSTLWKALVQGPAGLKARLEREFRPIFMTSTTGRSAQPVPFLYSQHDLDNLEIAGARIMEVGGTRPEWRHANLFPFAPHLAFWQAHYCSLGMGAFMIGTGGGKTLGTEGNIALIEKVKPEVLIGMPTFIYHILSEAVAGDHHWPQLQKLVLGGEKVPAGMRRKLRGLAAELGAGRVDVMATYAFTEAKMAWIECPAPAGAEPAGYHLYPDLGVVEVIDPESGRPVEDGRPGEIVFTALDARGTVVLRYRTGDRIDGGLTHEPCPHCGRTCPRLLGRISRVSEVRELAIDKLKGTLVDFNALEHVLDDIDGIGAWQIELRKRHDDPFESDEIIVHATATRPALRPELERTISRRFAEATEVRPNAVLWHQPEEMRDRQGVGRALKEEKLVDHRPRPEAPPPPSSATKISADEDSPALLR